MSLIINILQGIDRIATRGLTGVNNSLAYRVHEIERHLHGNEKWFGLAAVPDAEVHRADRMAGNIQPFALLSGNSDFGNWVQILGSDDTPVEAAGVEYDLHRVLITGTDSTVQFIVQIVSGESAGIAAKIAAEDFTEFPYISATNNNDSGISDIMAKRVVAGEKIWARTCCIGQDAKTINCYFGLHEYEG
jgi:hypothetical protein